MTDVEVVHPVPVDEVRGWLATLSTTFLEEADGETFDRFVNSVQRDWSMRRTWGARADGRWVATLATEARRITVPGFGAQTHDVMADALTAVTVNATHRRRGLLTRMLGQSLDQARDRGDPFSMLIAAEWPIYGRFGYAPATQSVTYTYLPQRASIPPSPRGALRQVEAADLGQVATDMFDRTRHARAGQVERPRWVWSRRLGSDGYAWTRPGRKPTFYLHESDGEPDGLLAWTGTREFELNGESGALSVSDLVAVTDTAYRNLWAYLGGIDLVSEITLGNRPVDEPAQWLMHDGRALRATNVRDDVWLRVLDVPGALSARGYPAGRVVLDVIDDEGGYATGRFALESDGTTSECLATRDPADLRLSQRCLAAIYLGNGGIEGWRLAGQVEQLRPDALAHTAAMFSSYQPPWNATGF